MLATVMAIACAPSMGAKTRARTVDAAADAGVDPREVLAIVPEPVEPKHCDGRVISPHVPACLSNPDLPEATRLSIVTRRLEAGRRDPMFGARDLYDSWFHPLVPSTRDAVRAAVAELLPGGVPDLATAERVATVVVATVGRGWIRRHERFACRLAARGEQTIILCRARAGDAPPCGSMDRVVELVPRGDTFEVADRGEIAGVPPDACL